MDKRKPYKRERILEVYREEIHQILDDAKKRTDEVIDRATRTYERLERKMNKNANKVRSLKLKEHHRIKNE